jgi:hypothetical protein
MEGVKTRLTQLKQQVGETPTRNVLLGKGDITITHHATRVVFYDTTTDEKKAHILKYSPAGQSSTLSYANNAGVSLKVKMKGENDDDIQKLLYPGDAGNKMEFIINNNGEKECSIYKYLDAYTMAGNIVGMNEEDKSVNGYPGGGQEAPTVIMEEEFKNGLNGKPFVNNITMGFRARPGDAVDRVNVQYFNQSAAPVYSTALKDVFSAGHEGIIHKHLIGSVMLLRDANDNPAGVLSVESAYDNMLDERKEDKENPNARLHLFMAKTTFDGGDSKIDTDYKNNGVYLKHSSRSTVALQAAAALVKAEEDAAIAATKKAEEDAAAATKKAEEDAAAATKKAEEDAAAAQQAAEDAGIRTYVQVLDQNGFPVYVSPTQNNPPYKFVETNSGDWFDLKNFYPSRVGSAKWVQTEVVEGVQYYDVLGSSNRNRGEATTAHAYITYKDDLSGNTSFRIQLKNGVLHLNGQVKSGENSSTVISDIKGFNLKDITEKVAIDNVLPSWSVPTEAADIDTESGELKNQHIGLKLFFKNSDDEPVVLSVIGPAPPAKHDDPSTYTGSTMSVSLKRLLPSAMVARILKEDDATFLKSMNNLQEEMYSIMKKKAAMNPKKQNERSVSDVSSNLTKKIDELIDINTQLINIIKQKLL